jgi:NAD(P)-dependent dehydrogenase (short-subunit alcohol dehydrogenase family)
MMYPVDGEPTGDRPGRLVPGREQSVTADPGRYLAQLFGLEGRVALVTGASSGLGAAVARSLAAAGAHVVVLARRVDRLEALADEIGAEPLPCDLLDDAQVAGIVDRAAERWGAPRILVNAAGMIFSREPAERESRDDVRRTLELDLVAPFQLAQQAFPAMRDAGGGAIVNVSSISGHVGVPGIPQASYAAGKLGLSGLTRELAVQWARHDIRVNTIAPGFFRSEITDGMYEDERTRAWLERNTPLPRHGTAEDLVGGILWLVSDAGRYVTGQTIVVDGGWTAR